MTPGHGIEALRPPGHVLPLCNELGYGSNEKGDPRYHNMFRQKVIEHRKRFISHNMMHGSQFPWDYHHEDVQRCARSFLQDNSQLFSQEEEEFVGPTLFSSIHDDRTRDNIAKMMCLQEYNAANAHKNLDPESEDDAEELPTSEDEDEDAAFDRTDGLWEADNDNTDIYDIPSSPNIPIDPLPFKVGKAKGPWVKKSMKELRRCIKKHLNQAYPPNGSKTYLSNELVSKTGRAWISKLPSQKRCWANKRMVPWMYRYFHTKSLYHIGDVKAVEEFMEDLLKGLQMKVSGSHMKLYEQCKRLVTNASSHFIGEELLVRKDGVLQRTELFEEAWIERHKKWLTQNSSEELVNSADLQVSSEDVQCGSQKPKRPRDSSHRSSFASPLQTDSAVMELEGSPYSDIWSEKEARSDKRQKGSSLSKTTGFNYHMTTIDLTDAKYTPGRWIHGLIPDLDEAAKTTCTDSFRAPMASMMPSPPRGESVITTMGGETGLDLTNSDLGPTQSSALHQAGEHSLASPQADHSWMASHDGLPANFLQQNGNGQSSGSVEPALNLNTDVNRGPAVTPGYIPTPGSLPDDIIIPQSAPELEVQAQSQAQGRAEQSAQAPTQPAAQPPAKVAHLLAQPQAPLETTPPQQPQIQLQARQLVFVLYGDMGAPDLANRIPWEQLRRWRVPEFFEQISARHPLVYQSATHVTLRCEWLKKTNLILHTDDRDDEWMVYRRTIDSLFEDAKELLPDETIFQVWVKAPNMRINAW